MFNIGFVRDPKKKPGYKLGYMMLDSSKEGFYSSITYWDTAQYEKHWHDAITRLVNGAECSALITDMPPPSPTGYAIDWWPMWREGDNVYVQEQLIIQSELKEVFDPSNPYVHIDPHITELESGDRPSEWIVPLQDFVEFLRANPK